MHIVTALFAGLFFGLGLALSGMTLPAKVLGFLDFTGNWDPSLAFVMGGALMVFGPTYFLLRNRREKPVFTNKFDVPSKTEITPRLLVGAGIFGAGWGRILSGHRDHGAAHRRDARTHTRRRRVPRDPRDVGRGVRDGAAGCGRQGGLLTGVRDARPGRVAVPPDVHSAENALAFARPLRYTTPLDGSFHFGGRLENGFGPIAQLVRAAGS